MNWIQMMGLPMTEAQLNGTLEIYKDALADLPEDLLMDSVILTIKNHKYHVLPKPGEIRAYVTGKLAQRKLLLIQAKNALR